MEKQVFLFKSYFFSQNLLWCLVLVPVNCAWRAWEVLCPCNISSWNEFQPRRISKDFTIQQKSASYLVTLALSLGNNSHPYLVMFIFRTFLQALANELLEHCLTFKKCAWRRSKLEMLCSTYFFCTTFVCLKKKKKHKCFSRKRKIEDFLLAKE